MSETLPMPVTAPLSTAQRAAVLNLIRRAADAEIMPRFKALDAGEIDTKAGPNDLVTVADTAAEAMITRGLQRLFPHAVIVGEEAAETDPDYRTRLSEAELSFLIDPVDGTWNFARGVPAFGTMVAACRFGRPVYGVIYDPVARDAIWADLDHSAIWITSKSRARPVVTAAPKSLGALTGFIELNFMTPEHKSRAATQCLALGHFNTLRCSAQQYRLLASGAVDFNLATKLSPWDHAAGVKIVQQAGGHAAMLDGAPYTTDQDTGYLLVASSEDVWMTLSAHFAGLLT